MQLTITKYVHACLVVETPDRVALFDPGSMSVEALGQHRFGRLDDIFITHVHGDHMAPDLIKELIGKFPTVRITSTQEVVDALAQEGIKATTTPPAGVSFFDAPHESVSSLFGDPPQEIGIHYLDALSDPGDSHSFRETKPILALPVTGPWGSAVKAMSLALELKPKHVLPIHDWHWNDQARQQMYDRFEQVLGEQGITFHKLETGKPVTLTI